MAAGAHLDEVAQRPRIGRPKNLRFRRVGEDAARRLPGHLAAERPIGLILELIRQSVDKLYVSLVGVGNRVEP